MTVFTTASSQLENNIIYFFDVDGRSFYDVQADFEADTLKVVLEQNRVIAFSKDVSALAPQTGQTVIELMPEHCTKLKNGDYIFDGVYAGAKPEYHDWSEAEEVWVKSPAQEAQQAADIELAIQAELSVLLAYAAQKISEYQDFIELAENASEVAIGEKGYAEWKQYRVALLKYQKGLILEKPEKPE